MSNPFDELAAKYLAEEAMAKAAVTATAEVPQETTSTASIDKADVRATVLALIAGCTDVDVLTTTVAKAAEKATRGGELVIVRKEAQKAIKTKVKEMAGITLTAKEMAAIFPEPKATVGPYGNLFTEFGVVDRIKTAHGSELMYVTESKEWFRFENNIWTQQPKGQSVRAIARDAIKGLMAEVAFSMDEDAQKKAEYAQKDSFVSGVCNGLATETAVSAASLDARPELLCVSNGAVDLRTGALVEPDPSMRLTLSTGCDYNPVASAKWFEQTLSEVFKGDEELISFFRRLVGYSLLANPKERVVVVPFGGGKNGKSTIINAIERTLGAHTGKMKANMIAMPAGAKDHGDGEGASPALLALRGKRLIFSEEIKRGSTFNDATIKSLASGGDKMQGRYLHSSEMIEFSVTGVIFAPSNVIPRVYDDDQAVWDRLLLLPFTARFDVDSGSAPDLERAAKLEAEAEGILAWAVAGALEYQKTGLRVPAKLFAIKEEARTNSSPINQFLAEECEFNEGYTCSSIDLWNAWRTWAIERGEQDTARRQSSFTNHLAEKRFTATKVGTATRGKDNRVRGWKGLCLAKDAHKQTPVKDLSTKESELF